MKVPSQRKILVPFNINCNDLNGVYHALALAERMQAKVVILMIHLNEKQTDSHSESWAQEALRDLVKSASQQGLPVTYHIAQDGFEKEITGLIAEENIDLLVFGASDKLMADAMLGLRPKIGAQLIKVKEKGTAHFV